MNSYLWHLSLYEIISEINIAFNIVNELRMPLIAFFHSSLRRNLTKNITHIGFCRMNEIAVFLSQIFVRNNNC